MFDFDDNSTESRKLFLDATSGEVAVQLAGRACFLITLP
jgi:hypothetical protein